jgi:hypothetical protein
MNATFSTPEFSEVYAINRRERTQEAIMAKGQRLGLLT